MADDSAWPRAWSRSGFTGERAPAGDFSRVTLEISRRADRRTLKRTELTIARDGTFELAEAGTTPTTGKLSPDQLEKVRRAHESAHLEALKQVEFTVIEDRALDVPAVALTVEGQPRGAQVMYVGQLDRYAGDQDALRLRPLITSLVEVQTKLEGDRATRNAPREKAPTTTEDAGLPRTEGTTDTPSDKPRFEVPKFEIPPYDPNRARAERERAERERVLRETPVEAPGPDLSRAETLSDRDTPATPPTDDGRRISRVPPGDVPVIDIPGDTTTTTPKGPITATPETPIVEIPTDRPTQTDRPPTTDRPTTDRPPQQGGLVTAVDEINGPERTQQQVKAPTTGKTHKVVKGDTLSGIAAKNGLTTRELFEANKDRLKSGNADKIFPGEELVIPARRTTTTPRTPAKAPTTGTKAPVTIDPSIGLTPPTSSKGPDVRVDGPTTLGSDGAKSPEGAKAPTGSKAPAGSKSPEK